MKLCHISSVFSHEILSNLNKTQNPASIQIITQFILLWQLSNSLSMMFEWKVLIRWVITIQRNFCLHRSQHNLIVPWPYQIAPIYRKGIHIIHSFQRLQGVIFFMFSMSFDSELTSGQWSRSTENWTSTLKRIPPASFPRYGPKFLVDCPLWWSTTSFRNLDQWMTIVLFQTSLHTKIRL